MKKHVLFLLCLLIGIPLHSQVLTQYNIENGIIKKELHRAKKNTKAINMPSFDLEQLIEEDCEMAFEDVPFRFGHGFDVDYTLNDGVWTNYDNGRLWSLTFSSKDANSLNFVFEDFSLPEGAYLYITNQSESVVYGPVMPESIPKDGYFLTDIIPGSEATICLFEPNAKKNASKLKIKRVVHGYRGFVINDSNGNVGGSASCNIPVENHPEYQDESNAVALIMLEDGSTLCSGSLIMTTDMSFKPYLLTAFHCISSLDSLLSDAEIDCVNHWAIKFGFKQSSNFSVTFNGAQFLSGWMCSDFSLVKILEDIKRFPLTWLGWDNTGNTPTNGAGIHHPRGDYMKISIDDDWFSNYSWDFDHPYNHWRVSWEEGIVQKGSSGSPLLDQNKRVVGQLHGARPEFGHDENTPPCDIPYTSYGKFSSSWTGAGSADKRLSNWLDSIGTGQQTMNTDHYYHISGDETLYNQSVYSITHIADLMSYFTVSWSLSGSNAPNFTVQSDTPYTNQCTVTRKEYPMNSMGSYVTLNAHIKYNGVTFATISKVITTPYIDGPDVPCGLTAYSVAARPENSTVVWSTTGQGLQYYTDPYYQPDDPTAYVINNDGSGTIDGVLTADIRVGNSSVGTISRHVDMWSYFTGTWYQQAFLNDTVNSTPQSFIGSSQWFAIVPNRKVYIQSSKIPGATVTYSSSGSWSVQNWSNNNGVISFKPMKSSGGNTGGITVQGTYPSSCKTFNLHFHALPQLSDPLLMSSDGNLYEFSIGEGSDTDSEMSRSVSDLSSWQLTIVDHMGRQMFSSQVSNSNKCQVITTGWKPGVYIAIAQIGDQYYSMKFSKN